MAYLEVKKNHFSNEKINLIHFKSTGCDSPNTHWIGDGYCDDETNNAGCNFDAGDCCGITVNTEWCTDCICY